MSNNITICSPAELPFYIAARDWDDLPDDIQEYLLEGWWAKGRLVARGRIDDLIGQLWARRFQTLSTAEQEVISTLEQDYEAMLPPYAAQLYGPR